MHDITNTHIMSHLLTTDPLQHRTPHSRSLHDDTSSTSSTDEYLDEDRQVEIIENLDHKAKLFGRIFRACFGALSLFLGLIALILCVLREDFGFLPGHFSTVGLHLVMVGVYCLCAYRSMRAKKNITKAEEHGDVFSVQDVHRTILWINVALNVFALLGWSALAWKYMDKLEMLPWFKRALVFIYAGMGPVMLFFTELSLQLMSNTNAELMSLWTYTHKYKSI